MNEIKEKKIIKNPVVNIFLLGDSLTGKTSIVNSFFGVSFSEQQMKTIGIDNYIKEIELKNRKKIKIQIYDTAGQEQYRSNAFTILKTKCEGIVLIYSITDEDSFNNIFEYWINELNGIIDLSKYPIYFIGNKCDLEEERLVFHEQAEKASSKYKFKFMETSAKTNINIQELFTNISQDIFDTFYTIENGEIVKKVENNNFSIDNRPAKKNFFMKIFSYIGKKIKNLFKKSK
jgi:small GTP-binding protein